MRNNIDILRNQYREVLKTYSETLESERGQPLMKFYFRNLPLNVEKLTFDEGFGRYYEKKTGEKI